MNNVLKEHSAVVLRFDIAEWPLWAGTVSVTVHVYPGGVAYEVELFGHSTNSARVETLKPETLMRLVRLQ